MTLQNSGGFPTTLVIAAPENANSADSISAVSHVVGVHFSTSFQANQYWPESGETT
jgi:hypothetical protein